MKKYKIEFTQSQKYIIDVRAKNEENAKKQATKKWNKICKANTANYHESEDPTTEISTVYDVTNTDDPFNP